MAESYGRRASRPHTEMFLDDSNLTGGAVDSVKTLVLLGSAQSGQPNTPYRVTSMSQAKSIFRGGELLDAMELAWNPSNNQPGAGAIVAIRVEDATPATLEVDGLTLTSTIYGDDANGIQVSLQDNALNGSKRFSIYFTKDRYQQTYDNIGNIFTIQYTGDQAFATLDVTTNPTNGEAQQLILKVGADAETAQAVRTYDLGEGVYEDTNVIVNDIDNLPDFQANMYTAGDHNVASNMLDAVAGQDIKAEPFTVKAIQGDLAKQLAFNDLIDVTIDKTKSMPDTIALTNLSGGSNGAVPVSWADKISLLANSGNYYIVPLTDSQAIHGEVSQFINDEYANGNPMRAIVGGGKRETTEMLISRRLGLRNDRVTLMGASGTRTMSDGRVYNFPAYMLAAMIGGLASGLPIGEPITYKQLNIDSLDVYFTGDQLDLLYDNGVNMVEFVRNRTTTNFRITSEVTTYNDPAEPVKNKMGLGEISDFLTSDLRNILDNEFIGTRIQNTSASIIKNRVESFLDRQRDVGGLIVSYEPDDVQVIINGNRARISFSVMPAQGLDYIDCYVTYNETELTTQ